MDVMSRRLVGLIAAVAVWVATLGAAALPAPALYADAQAKEQAVRRAMTTATSPAAIRKAARTVVATYESLVRHYPTSGYCDDALWNAAQLLIDVAKRLDARDEEATAAQLLKRLAAEYPTSKFARQVPQLVATLPNQPAAEEAPTVASAVSPAAGPPAVVTADLAAAAADSSVVPAIAPATTAAPIGAAPGDTALPAPASGVIQTVTAPAGSAPAPPRAAAAPSGVPVLTAIRRTVFPDAVRVTLELTAEATYHEETLNGPPRIFFDFRGTRAASSLADRTLRFDDDADIVRQVRVGRQPNNTTRVVIDMTGAATCNASPLYTPYRLVVECLRASSTPVTTRPSDASTPRSGDVDTTRSGPTNTTEPGDTSATPQGNATATPPGDAGLTRPSEATATRPRAAATPRTPGTLGRKTTETTLPPSFPPPSLPARTTVSGMAVPPALFARSLTAAVAALPRGPSPLSLADLTIAEAEPTPAAPANATAVALPPAPPMSAPSSAGTASSPAGPALPALPSRNSDGGYSMARQLGLSVSRIVIDPGHGGHDPGAQRSGASEADIVLDVALRLERLLQAEPGVDVVLTRRTDVFVPLEERTAIANRANADLFLSIHTNASSVAQVSGIESYFLNFATNKSAEAVAARENATSGQSMRALPDLVKAIALSSKLDESRDFASLVQQALVQKLRPMNSSVRDLGVKQAPFVVLVGASMPSVLAEVSFLTNDRELKLLKGQNYRQRIAEGLFAAVQKYQAALARGRQATQ
jgi:N-acetylmuramoyl-L-alanine amidase